MMEGPKNHEVSNDVEKYAEASRKFNKVYERISRAKDYVDKDGWEIHFEAYMTKGIPVEKGIVLRKHIKNSKMFPEILTLSMVEGKFNRSFSDGGPTKVRKDIDRSEVVDEILPEFESKLLESLLVQWRAGSESKEGESKKGDEKDLEGLLDRM